MSQHAGHRLSFPGLTGESSPASVIELVRLRRKERSGEVISNLIDMQVVEGIINPRGDTALQIVKCLDLTPFLPGIHKHQSGGGSNPPPTYLEL